MLPRRTQAVVDIVDNEGAMTPPTQKRGHVPRKPRVGIQKSCCSALALTALAKYPPVDQCVINSAMT